MSSPLVLSESADESTVRNEVSKRIRLGVDEAVRAIMKRIRKSPEQSPDGRARLIQILTESMPVVFIGNSRCEFGKDGEFLVLRDAPANSRPRQIA